MVGLIQYKLKATILEPMIALMIILFSLTSAFTVVLKVSNQNNIHQIARADAIADKTLYSTIIERKYLNEEFKTEGLRMEKSVSWLNKPNHLLKIKILVYDNKNKLLTLRQKVIISDELNEK